MIAKAGRTSHIAAFQLVLMALILWLNSFPFPVSSNALIPSFRQIWSFTAIALIAPIVWVFPLILPLPNIRALSWNSPEDPKDSKIHKLRSAAERTNSSLKEDFPILRKPLVRSLRRAAVFSQLGVITVLIDRVARFFIDHMLAEWKLKATGDPKCAEHLSPHEIPAYLKPFVQIAS
jgi:hypothetical protein